MKRKRSSDADDGDRSYDCCERRALLRGLGAAGLILLGRCSTPPGVRRPDLGVAAAADEGIVAADMDEGPPPVDASFVGTDGGLPPIDLAAPTVTQTATFALG
jgi:hypothetical protein